MGSEMCIRDRIIIRRAHMAFRLKDDRDPFLPDKMINRTPLAEPSSKQAGELSSPVHWAIHSGWGLRICRAANVKQ